MDRRRRFLGRMSLWILRHLPKLIPKDAFPLTKHVQEWNPWMVLRKRNQGSFFLRWKRMWSSISRIETGLPPVHIERRKAWKDVVWHDERSIHSWSRSSSTRSSTDSCIEKLNFQRSFWRQGSRHVPTRFIESKPKRVGESNLTCIRLAGRCHTNLPTSQGEFLSMACVRRGHPIFRLAKRVGKVVLPTLYRHEESVAPHALERSDGDRTKGKRGLKRKYGSTKKRDRGNFHTTHKRSVNEALFSSPPTLNCLKKTQQTIAWMRSRFMVLWSPCNESMSNKAIWTGINRILMSYLKSYRPCRNMNVDWFPLRWSLHR